MHLAALTLLASSPLWGSLEPGPYRPGYRIAIFEDATRLDGPKRGPFADPAGPHPRRLTVHLWYPAPADTPGEGITLAEYSAYNRLDARPERGLTDAARRAGVHPFRDLVAGQHRPLTDAEWQAMSGARGLGVYEAPAASGRFPLLIGTLRPLSTAITSEYLASHGYVVAFVATPTGFGEPWENDVFVRDMEAAAASLRREANVDPLRTGAIGFSGSGFAQVLLAMGNDHVDALVDLESAIFAKGFHERLVKSTAYRPDTMRAPFLHVYGRELAADPRAPEEHLQDFRDMRGSERLRVVLERPRLDHWDVATEGMATAAVTGMRGEDADGVRRTFEAANLYTRRFLDAHVKGDAAARAWLAEPPSSHGLEGIVTVEALPAVPPLATAADLERMLARRDARGIVSALTLARAADVKAPVLAEQPLNRMGYRLLAIGAQPEAIEVLGLVASIHEGSANAQDSLAEALEGAGRTQDALAASRHALELLAKQKEPNVALRRANEERVRRLAKP
jgi:hypothetical protein